MRSSFSRGFFPHAPAALALALAGLLGPVVCLAIPRPPDPGASRAGVRVLLGAEPRFSISGYDLSLNGKLLFPGASSFSVRCGAEPGENAGYVEFAAGKRAKKLDLESAGGFLHLDGKPYRARLTILPKGGACLAVNTLDLEKYVAGVISVEMPQSWPLEALKAQAVASRSYALFQVKTNSGRDFDLDSSTRDQVYEGITGETPRSVQAAEATRGLALAYGKSALKAYFHANCGGITEVPELVWGGEAHAFRPVICPYHRRQRDRNHWSIRLSRLQIESALKKITGLLPRSFVRLASLEAGAPDSSHRLSDVAISDGEGNNLLVSANAFRNAIGNTRLKSTNFQIRKDAQGYSLEGKGNGHGVGLCQVGARAMAEERKSFRQILRFYYPLAIIRAVL
jgi:stage II sporulation protein D